MGYMNGGGTSDVPDHYGQGTRDPPHSHGALLVLQFSIYVYISVYILPCLLCNFGSIGLVILYECSTVWEKMGDHSSASVLHVVLVVMTINEK